VKETAVTEIHPDMRDLFAAKEILTRTGDPEILRREWDAYGKRMSRPYPADLAVEDQTFNCPGAGRDGAIKVRIYRRKSAPGNAPCVIFLHGGGFVKGSLDSADSNAWGVADETGAVVVSVDYRLAPDFPYPAALNDAYESLRYIAANAGALSIDNTRIGLWGESAGANLVAGTALMARDKNGPSICAQVMIYGPFTDDWTSESYRVHANTVPGLTTAGIHKAWPLYTGGKSGDDLFYASPAKVKNLGGLPPAFVHYAEIDPIADDSPLFAGRLAEAGVPTTLRCAKGMIHGFVRARFSGSTAANEFSLPCMYLRGIFAAAQRGR
jgi:acetyl esterase